MIFISLGHVNPNIMLFKDKMKITGCKTESEAIETVMLLWENYIRPHKNLWALPEGHTYVDFLFSTVMRNVSFKLGFPIDRNKLNRVMNAPGSGYVSQYEPTCHTNVNIKTPVVKPANYKYDILHYDMPAKFTKTTKFSDGTLIQTDVNPYENTKKKRHDKPNNTFIVFGSSNVIFTGRYTEDMKQQYNRTVKFIIDCRSDIEELIVPLKPNTRHHSV
jgi:hypothetical protein